jgi:predicted glycoside hydrolase/deacetylase ChbG (UPF0249 family)
MRCRRIIINADDFGLSPWNNAGIIMAHEQGVMPSTSLMIGGDAAAEAVDYALQHPGLAVGLHVSFNDTKPVLPAEQVSLLVNPDGYFPPDDARWKAALRSAKGRAQIRAEIVAQFRAFDATGLLCDHVDTHRHAHRNPIMALILFREMAKWKMRATRIPWEPSGVVRYLRAVLLWRIAAYYGLCAPYRCIGRDWTAKAIVDLLGGQLPEGISELYFHPVTLTDHQFAADIHALLDPQVKEILGGLVLQSVGVAVLNYGVQSERI